MKKQEKEEKTIRKCQNRRSLCVRTVNQMYVACVCFDFLSFVERFLVDLSFCLKTQNVHTYGEHGKSIKKKEEEEEEDERNMNNIIHLILFYLI